MNNTNNVRKQNKNSLQYEGSTIILILVIFLFFPLLGALLIKNLRVFTTEAAGEMIVHFRYNGSFGWFIFWSIICFPVAIVLFIINGCTSVKYAII